MIRGFLKLIAVMSVIYILGYVAAVLLIIGGIIYLIKKFIERKK